MTCNDSVVGKPSSSSQVLPLNPMVSTTKVSPSQWPMDSPSQEGFGSSECGRPSVKICRHTCAPPSYTMIVRPGVCTMQNGYGVVVMRGTPGGRQRASGSSLEILSLCCWYTFSAQG